MDYVLQTNNLCKSYKGFKALDNLSLNVPRGSIYGFIGRNGAGKTTLIRIICGLQHPSRGDFTLYGRKNTDYEIGKSRRRLGSVVETPSVYLDMSAKENMKAQYLTLGLPSFEGLDEILSLVGLSDTGEKKVKNFSLGMKQRLGLGIALCGNPDFLVLDEPINGLDPEGIVEIRELILELNKERGITVLISSHILDELSRLATFYGFINKGHLVKEMSAKELEESCRKSIQVEVSDIKALARMLDKEGLEYKILSETEALIYSQVVVTDFVNKLSMENCVVNKIYEKDESLESFYMNLVGENHD